jgi:hypothetical protein
MAVIAGFFQNGGRPEEKGRKISSASRQQSAE